MAKFLEEILFILNDFNNPVIPLTKTALNRVESENLKEFYSFLTTKKLKVNFRNNLRPKCPIKTKNDYCLARYPYKMAMNKYIEGCGFKFESPCNISPALYEATASFLEKRV